MRIRLDQALVERGLAATRSRARDLIVRGEVCVDEMVATKPGTLVDTTASIAVGAEAGAHFVSRGANKLAHGLMAFGLSARGRVALDAGASTGGFTEVLLKSGASRVYAVDVGHGQLHPRLEADPRVVSLEGTDARTLDRTLVPEPVGAIVADVSFIPLALVLPALFQLAASGCWLIALVKPQFEVGRENIGKKGVARSGHEAAVAGVRAMIEAAGWRVLGARLSPIAGKEGNREYLLAAVRDD